MQQPGLRSWRILAGLFALPLLALPAGAQQVDTSLAALLIEPPPSIYVSTIGTRAAPGSSAGSPSAFGPNWGDGFVGGGVNKARYTGKVDGSLSAGFGLGNARDLVGLEVAISFLSLINNDNDQTGFLERNAVSFKAHRVFPENIALAVGWENALVLGGDTDGGRSVYAVLSKVQTLGERGPDDLFNTVTISMGLGNGRFREDADIRAGNEAVNGFMSVGVRVMEPLSVIADWTGQDLTLATSIVPFRSIPLVITPALTDMLGKTGDRARLTVGAGMGFQFASVRNLFIP